jgi:predicted GIY-YIG superfamily endonuclease
MSHNRTQYIYLLSNPITQEPFYVGCTCAIRQRRKQHIQRFSHQFNGLPPVFTILDFVHTRRLGEGYSIEADWINKYLSEGYRLINQRMVYRAAA